MIKHSLLLIVASNQEGLIKEIMLSSKEYISTFVRCEEIVERIISMQTEMRSIANASWSHRGINEILDVFCNIFKLNDKLFWVYYDPKILKMLMKVDRTLPIYGCSLCMLFQTIYHERGLDGEMICLAGQRHSFYKKLFILQILEGNVKRNFPISSLLVFLLDSLSSEHYLVIECTSLFISRECVLFHLEGENETFLIKTLIAKLLALEKQTHIPLRLKSFILDAVERLIHRLMEEMGAASLQNTPTAPQREVFPVGPDFS